MALEGIGEFIAEILFEGILQGIPGLYRWITRKDKGIYGYRTEAKRMIRFDVAKKFYLSWETDTATLKEKLKKGLETNNDKLDIEEFQFTIIGAKTIIQPPKLISFYSFHFLVHWLTEYKIKTVGIVETSRTAYTTYSDPNSENLIGQTDRGKKFFIALLDNYSKRQFLRINRSIETIEELSVERMREALLHIPPDGK